MSALILLQNIQSIPEKHLQGFCFQDSHIAFSTHFSWQVEYGRHESGNLANLFLELTVHQIPQSSHLILQTRVFRRVFGRVPEAILVHAAALVDVLACGEAQKAESESDSEILHCW